MASPSIKTRVLVISDTHCASLHEQLGRSPFSYPLPATADLLIHCGDLTYDGSREQYDEALDMLKQIDAGVKVVIAGNHDLSLDHAWGFSEHRKKHHLTEEQASARAHDARTLWISPEGRAKKEGIIYLDEGVHHLDLLNGARVSIYVSPYTPEFQGWGFPYARDEDRFNPSHVTLSDAKNIALHPAPSFTSASAPVHLMVTHGPPYGRLDRTDRGILAGCEHLLRAIMHVRPLLHCFGHIHEGWGAELVKWAKDADQATTLPTTIEEWRNGAWEAGVEDGAKGITSLDLDLKSAKDRHGVFLDFSSGNGRPLKHGSETLLLNASTMNVRYKPMNAPFIVDLDLPQIISVDD